jgi:tetratricopeptide (TPR) repeat protein
MLADEEAIFHFESALEMLNHAPELSTDLADSVELRLELSTPRMHLHSAADEEILRLCRDVEPIAEQIGDARHLLTLYRSLSSCLFSKAEYEECIRYGRRSIEIARAIGDNASVCTAAYTQAVHYLQTGQPKWVEKLAPPLLEWLEDTGPAQLFRQPYPPYITLAGSLGVACTMMGRLDESDRWHERSLKVAGEAAHSYGLALSHVLWGWTCYSRRDGLGCRRHGDEALHIAASAKLPGPQMMALYNLGIGHVVEGNVSEGLEFIERGLGLAETLGYVALRTEASYGLARGYLKNGKLTDAAAICEQALTFAEKTGERKLNPEFHTLLAEISMRRGALATDDAKRHLEAAISSATDQHMSLFASRSLFLLAKAYESEGDAGSAETASARARELMPAATSRAWLKDAGQRC